MKTHSTTSHSSSTQSYAGWVTATCGASAPGTACKRRPSSSRRQRLRWRDRAHLFADSAQLVENARRQRVSPEEAARRGHSRPADLVALDDAMNALGRMDPCKVQAPEMWFFGGLTVDEIAEVLTVRRGCPAPDNIERLSGATNR